MRPVTEPRILAFPAVEANPVSVRFEHEYPPGEWTTETVERALRTADEAYQIPRYGEQDVWESLRRGDRTGRSVDDLLTDARAARGESVPPLHASAYLEFARTGERFRYQRPEGTRLSRLELFALAECFEREGDYLDDVLDYAWAICEQSTWVVPAHLEGDHDHRGLPGAVADEDRVVALHSAHVAHLLAEVDYLLGDRLHPALRERIRHEVDRRVLTPYLARDDFWWHAPPAMNWNAVCNAGVLVAALHLLDDVERQARVVTKGVRSLGNYLAGFDDDGCTAEGIAYWDYGFGHYATLAAALEARTDGELSLLSPPVVRRIATVPLRVKLGPGRYVPFSDTKEEYALSPGVLSWLGVRLDVEGLGGLGRRVFAESGPDRDAAGPRTLRDLLWSSRVPETWKRGRPTRDQFFDGHDWWVARSASADPDGLIVAAKGGRNDEPHNHNDCGSVVVHYRGESLLTDLGRPTYDREYFDDDHRYEYLAARSLGHSVPYVDGVEQAAGPSHTADVLRREAQAGSAAIEFELADCYPEEAGLESLRRTLRLERGDPGRVTIADRARFVPDADGTFESVLVSYFPMETSADGLFVTGEDARATVTSHAEAAPVDVERLPEAMDDRDVWRARFESNGAENDEVDAAVSLTVSLESR